MKCFLAFILSCLHLAHNVQPMATDSPSDLTPTMRHESGMDTSGSNPSSGSKWSNVFKVSTTAPRFMATIRESPSEVYLCSATFIAKDVLITSARCLLGHDTEKLFVHSNSTSLEAEGLGNIAIKGVHLHPDFDMSPVTKDFGIITLRKPVDYVTPVYLPSKKIGQIGSVGTAYTWRFTPTSDKFLIHEHQSKIISNSKCFLIEQETIPEDMACAAGPPFQEGHFDHGMPFIINKKGKSYLFGINHITSKVLTEKVDKVWRIDRIVPWITDVLKDENIKRKKLSTQKPSVTQDDKEENEDDEEEEEEDEEEDKEEKEEEHM